MLLLHHANKEGDQRGTSQREDALDVIVSMQRSSDYTPQQGARFELHFEKARGLHGEALEPIEVRLETAITGMTRWHWQPLEQSEFDRTVRLLRDGLPPLAIMRELGLSRSGVYRMRDKAKAMGLLATDQTG